MRYLLWISYSLVSAVAFADLPKDPTSKDELKKLQTAALNYSDNQTPGSAEGLRKALRESQAHDLLKGLGDPNKLSDAQLKNLGKTIQIAESCEVLILNSSGFIMRGVLFSYVPSASQLKAWAQSCGYAGAKISGAPPKISSDGTGQ